MDAVGGLLGGRGAVWIELALAVLTFIGLRFITAPYGRFGRGGWGPTVPGRVGWVLMEAPAPLVFAAVYLAGDHRASVVPLVMLCMWQSHYLSGRSSTRS